MAEAPLGVFGGTFDPVHAAHITLASCACGQLGLEKVLWIPAGKPPHRDPPRVSAKHRLAMVALAIADDARFMLDASEVDADAPSYTVATLRRLRQQHGQRPLVLLVGADAFLGLASWHRWEALFDLAHIAVATRPGYVFDATTMTPALRAEYRARHEDGLSALRSRAAGSIVRFDIPPLDISASGIRAKLAAGQPVRGLLDEKVFDYIAANHLYADP